MSTIQDQNHAYRYHTDPQYRAWVDAQWIARQKRRGPKVSTVVAGSALGILAIWGLALLGMSGASSSAPVAPPDGATVYVENTYDDETLRLARKWVAWQDEIADLDGKGRSTVPLVKAVEMAEIDCSSVELRGYAEWAFSAADWEMAGWPSGRPYIICQDGQPQWERMASAS